MQMLPDRNIPSIPLSPSRSIAVQIFGEIELDERIRNGDALMSHCISIRNYHRFMPPLSTGFVGMFRDILHLEFHDVETRDWLPPNSDHIPIPEKHDIVRTIGFFNNAVRDPDFTGFTVHCWRGVSRSAAIATGIVYLILGDEKQTLEYLRQIRPQVMPLPRILRFWDEVLGSELSAHSDALRKDALEEMRRRFLEEIWGPDDQLEELHGVDDQECNIT